MTPDLQALRGGEERHSYRVANDGIGYGACVDHQWVDATPPGRDRACEADRPGAHDEDIFGLRGVVHFPLTAS
jgi:hypothetical protein